jgi:hypothetical protein
LLEGERSRLLVPPSSTHVGFVALEQLLEQCAVLLDNEQVMERVHAMALQYFAPIYRERLQSRRWSLRMNSLYMMEKFALRELEEDIAAVLERQSSPALPAYSDEVAQICKLLAMWDSPRLPARLLEHAPVLSDFHMKLILSKMSGHQFARMIMELDRLPSGWRWAVVDMIGLQRMEAYQADVERWTASEEPELRIRALTALSRMSLIAPKPAYAVHADSASWQERMSAAKLYATIRHPMYLPCLQRLLSDSSWWVRTQAAQAIARYPQGLEVLSEIAATTDDPYARDMAHEWRERGERLDGLA